MLATAAVDFGSAPARVPNFRERLPHGQPIDVDVADLASESVFLAPILAIEPQNAIAQRTNPFLAWPKLAAIADVEIRCHPGTVNRVYIVTKLIRRCTEPVLNVFDEDSNT